MEERVVLEGLTELAFLVEQPWQRRHRRGVLEKFRRVSSSGFVERGDEFFFRPKNLGEDLEVLSMDGADRRRWVIDLSSVAYVSTASRTHPQRLRLIRVG